MLATTTNAEASSTNAMMTGRSPLVMAVTASWPRPPMPKTFSTTTTPPSRVPMSMPSWDTTGVSAPRSACR